MNQEDIDFLNKIILDMKSAGLDDNFIDYSVQLASVDLIWRSRLKYWNVCSKELEQWIKEKRDIEEME